MPGVLKMKIGGVYVPVPPLDHVHANMIQRVVYTTFYPARPVGAAYVEWVGPTQPAGMIVGDTWIATNP